MKQTNTETGPVVTRACYWLVCYGGVYRTSQQKLHGARDAARDTFGVDGPSVQVKALTTSVRELRRAGYTYKAMNTLEGWQTLGGDEGYKTLLSHLRDHLHRISKDNAAHTAARTYIFGDNLYFTGGAPALWSSDAARAFIFRDEKQAEELRLMFPAVLAGATIRQFPAAARQAARHTRPGKVVGCPFNNCNATVIKFEPVDDRDVPTYLNITFPITLHTCGEQPEGVELIMLPAELINLVADHSTLTDFGREAGKVKMFGLTTNDYGGLASKVRALLVGEKALPSETPQRTAPASAVCEQSPESMALDLARELVRQEEEGGRVQRICECKGSALVNAKDLPQHRGGKKSPCLYAMAVAVLVQAGEREKGVKQS